MHTSDTIHDDSPPGFSTRYLLDIIIRLYFIKSFFVKGESGICLFDFWFNDRHFFST